MRKIATAVVAFLFLVSPRVHADWVQSSQMFSLQGGGVFPSGSLDVAPGDRSVKIAGTGFLVGGEYLFHTMPQLAFGMGIDYVKFGSKSSDTVGGASTTSHSHSMLLMGLAEYAFWTENHRTLPFVKAGLGLHVSQLKIEPSNGPAWVDDNRTGVALAAAFGTDTPLTPHATLGFEARYTYLGSATYNPTLAGRNAGLTGVSGGEHLFQLLANFGFQF